MNTKIDRFIHTGWHTFITEDKLHQYCIKKSNSNKVFMHITPSFGSSNQFKKRM